MPDRDDGLLLDMLLAARKVLSFTEGVTGAAFSEDQLLQSAIAYQLQIVGEAASRVSASCQNAHPDVPWREVVGLRNRIVHDYTRLNLDLIWSIVKDDLIPLVEILRLLIPPDTI